MTIEKQTLPCNQETGVNRGQGNLKEEMKKTYLLLPVSTVDPLIDSEDWLLVRSSFSEVITADDNAEADFQRSKKFQFNEKKFLIKCVRENI